MPNAGDYKDALMEAGLPVDEVMVDKDGVVFPTYTRVLTPSEESLALNAITATEDDPYRQVNLKEFARAFALGLKDQFPALDVQRLRNFVRDALRGV